MHLHAHSHYSPLDGAGSPEEMAQKAVELGHSFISITDHGTVTGHYPLFLACKKLGIKPVYGVEGYIRFDEVEGGVGNEGIPHITLLAKTRRGYENLSRLVTIASRNLRGTRPTFTITDLENYAEGLIVTTGCPTGIPTRLLVGNDLKIEKKIVPTAAQIAAANNFVRRIANLKYSGAFPVVEVVAQPGFLPSEVAFSYLESFSKEHGLDVVLTADSHFVNKTDFVKQDAVIRIATEHGDGRVKRRVEKEDYYSIKELENLRSLDGAYGFSKAIPIPWYQFLCSKEGMIKRAVAMGVPATTAEKWADNAIAIGESVEHIEIKNGRFPKYTQIGPGISAVDLLRSRCTRGIETDERKARLEYELEVISRKGIADYFLILADLVGAIASEGHIIVCRGSAGGSLVAYSCGISQTDPILHDLSFERFYDEEREEAPDIDLDFSPEARKKAVEYLAQRYNVAKILSLSMLSRKQALIDMARLFDIDREEIEGALSVCNDDLDAEGESSLPDEISDLYRTYPLLAIAEKLIGIPRQEGKNAAGLIVCSQDDEIPVTCIYDKHGERIATIDKTFVDKLGLMKADILSVSAIGVIESAIRRIQKSGRPNAKDITKEFLYSLDPYSEDADLWLKNAMRFPAGIFQLDGAVLPTLETISAKSSNSLFKELFTASALARPGAMRYIKKYAQGLKTGDEILDETNNVIVFQEQLLKYAKKIGIKSPNAFRRAVCKSKSAEVIAMIAETGDRSISRELLDNMINHGKYSFNKSHCLTYSLLTLIMAYLKFFFPEEFLEAYLNCELDSDNPNMSLIRRLIFEERVRTNFGMKVVPLTTSLPKGTYFRYKNHVLSGSYLASGSKIRSALEDGKVTTQIRSNEVQVLSELSNDYTMEFSVDTPELLKSFPWVPITQTVKQNNDPFPAYDEIDWIESSGILTEVYRMPQTKAMPFAMAGFVIETNRGLVHGKISAKKFKIYSRLLDTPIGNVVHFNGRVERTRLALRTIE